MGVPHTFRYCHKESAVIKGAETVVTMFSSHHVISLNLQSSGLRQLLVERFKETFSKSLTVQLLLWMTVSSADCDEVRRLAETFSKSPGCRATLNVYQQ
jgi:hypothetical protein